MPPNHDPDYTRRLVVDLPDDVHDELNRLIPWGVKSQIFRVICEDLISMLRANPDATLGALLTRSITLTAFQKFTKGRDENG